MKTYDYQELVDRRAASREMFENIEYLNCGLIGETGELAEEVKKMLRDDGGALTDARRAAIQTEAGDVLYADAMMYRTEVRDFRQPGTWDDPILDGPTLPYRLQSSTPQDAERQFLERFVELCVATGRVEAANEGMLALEQLESPPSSEIQMIDDASLSVVDYALYKIATWLVAMKSRAARASSKADSAVGGWFTFSGETRCEFCPFCGAKLIEVPR